RKNSGVEPTITMLATKGLSTSSRLRASGHAMRIPTMPLSQTRMSRRRLSRDSCSPLLIATILTGSVKADQANRLPDSRHGQESSDRVLWPLQRPGYTKGPYKDVPILAKVSY